MHHKIRTRKFSRLSRFLILYGIVLCLPVLIKAQNETYRLEPTGPSSVYAGSSVYFHLTETIRSPTSPTVQFTGVTLSSAPVNYSMVCNIYECVKNPTTGFYQITLYPGTYKTDLIIVRADIPAGTSPGQYTLTISAVDNRGTAKPIDIPLRVKEAPIAVPDANPGPAGPIPNFSRWESMMTRVGMNWCDPTARYNFGDETQVWFYDGARVFFQIADYTHDSRWQACAFNVARQYRDFVLSVKGKINSYDVFTRGLRMAYERSGDPSYRNAVIALASVGYVEWQAGVSDEYIREDAYALNSLIDAEKLGQPRSPHMARLVDYLLAHFDRLFVAKTYRIHQTFFDGLAAAALIDYYELTHDPRIPPTIKLMLDWMWNYGWDKRTNSMYYNPDPPGPTCPNGCRELHNGLDNLIIPAFAWYWHVTGNDTYRQWGDAIFAHALDEDISYNGKIFSQNYEWSFDYVRWRPQGTTQCTYNVTWPAGQIPASGGDVSISVATQPGCSWAVAESSSWLTISGGGGSGPGTTTATIQPNSSTATRAASLTVAGKSGTITQAGQATTLSGVSLAASTVSAGSALSGNVVSLSGPAAVPTIVLLSSSNPAVASVPASVIITSSSTSAAFTIQTSSVAASGDVTITASCGGASKTASFTVQAASSASPKVIGISLSRSSLAGGSVTNNRVMLDGPAGPNGAVVNLASSNPNVAAVPAVVSVWPGQSYASFPVTTSAVGASTDVFITASTATSQQTASLTVSPARLLLLTLGPSQTMSGKVLVGRAYFDGPLQSGVTIFLTNSNPGLAVVPGSLVAAGGETFFTFTVPTVAQTSSASVTITATYQGIVQSATATLSPAL